MTTLIEQINNNKLFDNNLKNCKAGIIPHAGKQYSGICRHNCFIYFNRNTKYIIYIAALHKFSPKNTTYVLYNTIEKFTKITGIHSFTGFLQRNGIVKDCGCNKRKEALNKAVPYKNKK